MRSTIPLTLALLIPAAGLVACSPSPSQSSTASAAPAAAAAAAVNPLKPSDADVAKFRDLEVRLWEAWNKRLNPADAAPFYSKAPGNLYFDFSPLKFTGWAEYQETAAKALGSMNVDHAVTRIDNDFTLLKDGNLAVAAFTFHVDFYSKDGTAMGMTGRETDAWVNEDGKWLVAHQHMSIPDGGSGASAQQAAQK